MHCSCNEYCFTRFYGTFRAIYRLGMHVLFIFCKSWVPKKSIFGVSDVNCGAPKNASKTNTDTMASPFNDVEYHKDFLPYEKSFLDLEKDMSRLQVFLQSNYQTLVFQSHFIVSRARPLILSMQIVPSDLRIGFLFGAILEKIGIDFCSQNSFPDESLQKAFDSITETFLT